MAGKCLTGTGRTAFCGSCCAEGSFGCLLFFKIHVFLLAVSDSNAFPLVLLPPQGTRRNGRQRGFRMSNYWDSKAARTVLPEDKAL